MVNPVGPAPQQVNVQQQTAVQQQEVRQRNEQTQARESPPATTQQADQRTLQSPNEDGQRRQNQLVAQQRRQQQSEGTQAPANTQRGQIVDIEA